MSIDNSTALGGAIAMTTTLYLSVIESRNHRDVNDHVYLVWRGNKASAHSKLEWALDDLVARMKKNRLTKVEFLVNLYIKYDQPHDKKSGYGLELHRPFTPEEQKQIWDGISRRLPSPVS
jgi:hypothetical protein